MRIAAAVVLAWAGMLAACSGEVVGGGQKPVETRAVADGGGSASRAPTEGPRLSAANGGARYQVAFASAGVTGTVDFDARVTLIDAGGGQERATDGAATAHLVLGSGDSALVAREQVAAVPYVRARVAFTRVHAAVTGGLVLGGSGFTGSVDVPIAAGDSVVVEAPVAFSDPDRPYTLVIDLGAGTWLAAASSATHQVPASTFRGAVTLRAH